MNTNDERLRDLLRQADPVAGDPGLTPEEVKAMRRAVLTSIPEPRRRWISFAALAGATLAALLLALMLLSPASEGPAAPPRPPARMAEKPRSAPAPIPVPPPAPEPVVQEPEKPRETRALRKRTAPEPVPEVIAETAPVPSPDEPEVEAIIAAETRQIQFSTPGGTRIIWVLTSGGASH
jgi:outer membrane biosynthesis protein TonB